MTAIRTEYCYFTRKVSYIDNDVDTTYRSLCHPDYELRPADFNCSRCVGDIYCSVITVYAIQTIIAPLHCQTVAMLRLAWPCFTPDTCTSTACVLQACMNIGRFMGGASNHCRPLCLIVHMDGQHSGRVKAVCHQDDRQQQTNTDCSQCAARAVPGGGESGDSSHSTGDETKGPTEAENSF